MDPVFLVKGLKKGGFHMGLPCSDKCVAGQSCPSAAALLPVYAENCLFPPCCFLVC